MVMPHIRYPTNKIPVFYAFILQYAMIQKPCFSIDFLQYAQVQKLLYSIDKLRWLPVVHTNEQGCSDKQCCQINCHNGFKVFCSIVVGAKGNL